MMQRWSLVRSGGGWVIGVGPPSGRALQRRSHLLRPSQQRILECTRRVAEANADLPYTLFVPSSYDRQQPTPLVVDLHGLNITPLQQMLFDGTTDFAERHGFIVVAAMGFNLWSWWGSRPGTPVATAAAKPGGDGRYTTTELGEIDTMALLRSIREQ